MGLFVFIISFLIILLLVTYFMRSSQEMPKNLQQLLSECRVQIGGALALTEDMLMRSRNKVELFKQPEKLVIITGGNRGIGLKIVEKLLECGMTIVLGVRDPEGSKRMVEKALDLSKTKGKVSYEKLDIGNMQSVHQFAGRIKQKHSKIDILINNAGVMCVPFKMTPDNFESHMAINHYGHFLQTHLLLPEIKAAGCEGTNSRIVNVSSCVHKIGYINYDDMNGCKHYYPSDAYNQSKLAQVLFTKHLEVKLKEDGAHTQVHSLHPGVVDTDLFENSNTTLIPWFRKLLFKTAEEGSRTVVYTAISPKLEGKGGTYISNCNFAKSHPDAKSPAKCEKFFKYSCDQLSIKNFGEAK